jgi:hypothetical protein
LVKLYLKKYPLPIACPTSKNKIKIIPEIIKIDTKYFKG